MPPVRVLVLHNEPVLPADHPDAEQEFDVYDTVDLVTRRLVAAGFEVRRLGVGLDPTALVAGLRAERPNVVFNAFEGLTTQGQTETTAAGLLEWLGVPFTGSPSASLSLTRDKYRMLQVLRGGGVPVPASFLVERPPCPPCPLVWPVIVKPAAHDASVGIEQASVVTDQAALERRVAYVLERYGPPVLVEEYLDGRELRAHLVEEVDADGGSRLHLLPLEEMVFLDKDPGFWKIYSYDAKWRPGSREYLATFPRSPVPLEPGLAREIDRLSRAAFHLAGCRDYVRVDFRLTADDTPFVLEVNAKVCPRHPALDPESEAGPAAPGAELFPAEVDGLLDCKAALAEAGRTNADFTLTLVRNALVRAGKPLAPLAPASG